jgi:lipoate-protein ligase A
MPVPAVSALPAGRWWVERWSGGPAEFFERPWPDLGGPTVSLVDVERPTLVLGSTQAPDVVDADHAARADVTVARRHSGGGAVLLRPGEVAWVDVFVPAADAFWEPDLVRSFAWLGKAWVDALADVGVDARAADRPAPRGRWDRLACFAAIGAGEVTVEGRKVVGMSQRRSRVGSRFQCVALLGWEPAATADLLALAPSDRQALADHLAGSATGLGLTADAVEDAFLGRLAAR